MIARAACFAAAGLSVATCVTTFTPGARQAMSAVNTGMPASLASLMAGPMATESHGRQHDGGDLLDDEILDLVLLFGHVELAAHHQHLVTVLAGLLGHAVADLLEERVGQREDGQGDGALGGSSRCAGRRSAFRRGYRCGRSRRPEERPPWRGVRGWALSYFVGSYSLTNWSSDKSVFTDLAPCRLLPPA